MNSPSLVQKLTLIDDPLGCYLVCHTINRRTGYRRISSIVLDRGNRHYKRIIRAEDFTLWHQLKNMLP